MSSGSNSQFPDWVEDLIRRLASSADSPSTTNDSVNRLYRYVDSLHDSSRLEDAFRGDDLLRRINLARIQGMQARQQTSQRGGTGLPTPNVRSGSSGGGSSSGSSLSSLSGGSSSGLSTPSSSGTSSNTGLSSYSIDNPSFGSGLGGSLPSLSVPPTSPSSGGSGTSQGSNRGSIPEAEYVVPVQIVAPLPIPVVIVSGSAGTGGQGGHDPDYERNRLPGPWEAARGANPFGKGQLGEAYDWSMSAAGAMAGDPGSMANLAKLVIQEPGKRLQAAQEGVGMIYSGMGKDRFGESASDMLGGVQKLDRSVSGPLGSPVGWAAGLGKAAVDVSEAFRDLTDQLHANNMAFADFSGAMAQVQARSDVQQIMLDIKRGDRRAESAGELAEARMMWERRWAKVEDLMANITNKLLLKASSYMDASIPILSVWSTVLGKQAEVLGSPGLASFLGDVVPGILRWLGSDDDPLLFGKGKTFQEQLTQIGQMPAPGSPRPARFNR